MLFGFGKKKKAEQEAKEIKKEVVEKKPLLMKENIILNCERMEKNDTIRKVGQILVDSGYVKEDYIEGMIARELTFSTNMGNCIALPHGTNEVKKEVLESGIAVLTFPEGTDWGGEDVKLVIGIAGVGDEHLEILANIATKLVSMEEVDKLVNGNNVDLIYDTFMKED